MRRQCIGGCFEAALAPWRHLLVLSATLIVLSPSAGVARHVHHHGGKQTAASNGAKALIPPHIDLVTPDDGYGTRRNPAVEKARHENLPRPAPLIGAQHGPQRSIGPRRNEPPPRNAIGIVMNRPGPTGRPDHHAPIPSAIGAPARDVADAARTRLPAAVAPSPALAPTGLSPAGGIAGTRSVAPGGAAEVGRPGAPHTPPPIQKTASGINGTGMARPRAAAAAAVGGSARTLASINGTSLRPKH